jgi:hypothetical protein
VTNHHLHLVLIAAAFAAVTALAVVMVDVWSAALAVTR